MHSINLNFIKAALSLGSLANKQLADLTTADMQAIASAFQFELTDEQTIGALAFVNANPEQSAETVAKFILAKADDGTLKSLMSGQKGSSNYVIGELVRCTECENPFTVSHKHIAIRDGEEELICPHCRQVTSL